MLTALMDGGALTAGELARAAGVSAPTASAHLAKLEAGGLIAVAKQGRHRYFRLAHEDIAEMLEKMMGVAARTGHLRTRPGPADPVIRKARVCYDHLAGELGVLLFEAMAKRRLLREGDGRWRLTARGEAFAQGFGIDMEALCARRRALCLACLDWSMRRHHLAGSLGAAMLDSILVRGWARRARHSRAVVFTPDGEAKFRRLITSL